MGKDQRVIPLFPELRKYLEETWEVAREGSEHIITRYRGSNTNLRTQLIRIIERAGLKPWPKLFQNPRASRERELANQFPAHVVTAWIGHTERIATKHYLQVTDEHYAKAAQKPAQQLRAPVRTDKQMSPARQDDPPVLPDFVTDRERVYTCPVGPEGFEPPTKGL